jgi:hypothetical protein
VWLKGSYQFVVRDISDFAQPTTISTFAGAGPKFASAADVSYVVGPSLLRMRLSGTPQMVAEQGSCGGLYKHSFAWSRDGQMAAYMSGASDRSQGLLHLVSDGQDRVVGSVPALPWTTSCPYLICADKVDTHLLFSPDGAYVSFVDNLDGLVQSSGRSSMRVWTLPGTVLKNADSGSESMSVWSGDTLYFRDDKAIEAWRAGTELLVLPGVAWIRPNASPVGGQIVYEVRDSSGTAHVNLFDVASAQVRELKSSRSEPAFVTSRYIWYQEEGPCSAPDPISCTTPSTMPTGKTFIYDLQNETEAASTITAVWDVWPHAV